MCMLLTFMSITILLSILIAALSIGILLLLARLRRANRSAAESARENEHLKTLMQQELATLRQKLEQRTAAHALDLERAKGELDALSYSVSHDLSAPARTINGFAELLKSEASVLSDDGRGWLERIQYNSQRLGDMINDLLRLSRLGRAKLDLREVDLNPLVAEAARVAGAGFPGTQVSIAPLPGIRCDRGLTTQLLQTLLANAFKFSAKCAAPRIEVGVQEIEGKQCFFVRDNGAGFNPRYADKLFQMFQRLHKEADFPGIGAGLAIAKSIVQRHGGRIWAESLPGEGASFYFTLDSTNKSE